MALLALRAVQERFHGYPHPIHGFFRKRSAPLLPEADLILGFQFLPLLLNDDRRVRGFDPAHVDSGAIGLDIPGLDTAQQGGGVGVGGCVTFQAGDDALGALASSVFLAGNNWEISLLVSITFSRILVASRCPRFLF